MRGTIGSSVLWPKRSLKKMNFSQILLCVLGASEVRPASSCMTLFWPYVVTEEKLVLVDRSLELKCLHIHNVVTLKQ